MTGEEILVSQQLVRNVALAPHVQDYAIRLTMATHPGGEFATASVNKYVRWGSSPRGAQAVVLAAKVYALMDGRFNVGFEDIRKAATPALRHRMLLNFEGEAEGIVTDTIVSDILEQLPTGVPVGTA
jgi:MoxR-like ATPase